MIVNNTRDYKLRRQVRFRNIISKVSLCSSPLDKIQSLEEWNSVWYSGPELQSIRNEARTICLLLKKCNKIESYGCHSNVKYNYQQRNNLYSRGLEKHINSKQQHRCIFASKCILYASSLLVQQQNSTNKIAAVAVRCTAYATDLAIQVTWEDFVDAYYDEIHLGFFDK
jgi:hypothetical protein